MADAVYVHVPFCHSKCGYCAFYSVVAYSSDHVACWHSKILDDLARFREKNTEPLHSIFVGGGTPSVLPERELKKLLSALNTFPKADDFEFTMEANPESLTPAKMALMRENGVNRLSLGVQSMNPVHLKTLQRQTTVAQIQNVFADLKSFNFDKVNVDLIYAIPNQALSEIAEDVSRVLDFGIEHLSAYALTAEEGARLAPVINERDLESLAVDAWEKFPDWLAPYGLRRYEISNYAKPEKECVHNLRIWQGGTYAAFGPSASSFDGHDRATYPADLNAWLHDTPPDPDTILARARAAEMLAFGLRTIFGWEANAFLQKTNFTFRDFFNEIDTLQSHGWVDFEPEKYLRPTPAGMTFWNAMAETLI